MKFRCKMVDTVAMRDFTNIVNIVSRMSRMCVICLTPTQMCFNACEDGTPVVWAELSHTHFFNEYLVVGVSDLQNEIYLEFDAVMLGTSLSSLKQTARSTKIKLTNKLQPCLTIEIELPTLTTESCLCVHDVPVRVIPRKEWPIYKAPNVPDFHICIDLPPLKQVRKIVERMKNMSPCLMVCAENSGKFVLKIDTDSASVATHFEGLHVSTYSEDNAAQLTANVDVRRFLTFLAWEVVHPVSVKCNILNEQMIYLYLNLDDNVNIHYFIPAVSL